MRKPVVNYREFRLSKINEPQFKHLKFLFGWFGYFLLFFLTEKFIPYERCHVVHCKLDDIIPFCEYFAIFYVGWYFLIIGSLLYFALYNPENFKNMMKFIIVTQIIAMAAYILFPSRQELRPSKFVRDNIFTDVMKLIYSIDTNTNVCPSLHVAYSVGIASTWLKEKSASKLSKALITAFSLAVCVSVSFVKQHSVVDIIAALPMCLLAELISFGDFYVKRRRSKKACLDVPDKNNGPNVA